ncbi:hypothetical protein SDC9_157475 [bioreactor metagenome]|uniref:Uncharacterized protein n=1 Tax=bioreactor metagenome TaxID=1076179 RepID=A0A645F8E5_9ZZZZ
MVFHHRVVEHLAALADVRTAELHYQLAHLDYELVARRFEHYAVESPVRFSRLRLVGQLKLPVFVERAPRRCLFILRGLGGGERHVGLFKHQPELIKLLCA